MRLCRAIGLTQFGLGPARSAESVCTDHGRRTRSTLSAGCIPFRRVDPALVLRQKKALATHTATCRYTGVYSDLACTSTGSVVCTAETENWRCTFDDAGASGSVLCYYDFSGGAYCSSNGDEVGVSVSCTRIPGVLPSPGDDGYCEWTPTSGVLSGPADVTLPLTSTGQTSTQEVTITNNSAPTVTVSATNLATAGTPFSITTNTCNGVPLATGQSCAIGIQFAPISGGMFTNTLSAQYDGAASPLNIPISGTAIVPSGTFTGPTTATFAAVIAGEDISSQSLSFSVTTMGGFGVGSIISTNPAFSVDSQDCTGTYTMSRSCTVRMSFSPTVLGTNSGQLRISHGGVSSPHVVSLEGEGLAGGASLRISPPVLTFAPGEVGLAPGQVRRFTVTNVGTGTFPVGTIEYGAPDFQVTNTSCVGTLGAGSSCAIDVRFSPSVGGLRAASLRLYSLSRKISVLGRLVGLGRPVEECK
jgi:hypothetical protein